jgi:hypothetical protein
MYAWKILRNLVSIRKNLRKLTFVEENEKLQNDKNKQVHRHNVILCLTKPLSFRQAAFSTSTVQETSPLSAEMIGDSCMDNVEGLQCNCFLLKDIR